MSVSVYRGEEMIRSKGYAFSDQETEASVEPSATLLRIGNVSKIYKAADGALLIEKGNLDLNQPIQVYVPGFPVTRHAVIVEEIAWHNGGIQYYHPG